MNEDPKTPARFRSFVLIGGPLDGDERVVDNLVGPIYFMRPGSFAWDRFIYEWRTYRMRGDAGADRFEFLVYAGLTDREAERLIMPQLTALKLPGLAASPAITR